MFKENTMPAKLFIFIISGLFIIGKLYAQSDSSAQAFIKTNFKPFVLPLTHDRRDIKAASGSPFNSIEVLDYRADTSRIGFSYDRNQGHKELLLHPGVETAIHSFLNNSFANHSASSSLLVVIRRLWISEISPKEPQQAFTGKPHTTRISFRAESYLKHPSGYIPHGYLDTTITAALPILQVTPFRIPDLFTAFMKKMIALDLAKSIKTKRSVSLAFIDSFSNRKFNYIMNKTATLQKGVYASLDDFRNNKPSINNYVVEAERGDLSLYMKDEEGKTYFSRKIWGYCDGEGSFIMINGNLYPVLRQKNAYYIFGAKEYQIKTTRIPIFLLFPMHGYIAGSIPVSQKVIMKLRMFTLDPETGEID